MRTALVFLNAAILTFKYLVQRRRPPQAPTPRSLASLHGRMARVREAVAAARAADGVEPIATDFLTDTASRCWRKRSTTWSVALATIAAAARRD